MTDKLIGKVVRITNKKHPHFGEMGTIEGDNIKLSISALGSMDKVKTANGNEFFVSKGDYEIIALPRSIK